MSFPAFRKISPEIDLQLDQIVNLLLASLPSKNGACPYFKC